MTLQMNETALILQEGFTRLAEYKKFTLCPYTHKWECESAVCLQRDKTCIVRLYWKGKQYTKIYNNPQLANAYIKRLIADGYKLQKGVN